MAKFSLRKLKPDSAKAVKNAILQVPILLQIISLSLVITVIS